MAEVSVGTVDILEGDGARVADGAENVTQAEHLLFSFLFWGMLVMGWRELSQ